ncbi:MAG: glycosyltransferase [Thermoplasmata archaeon]
MKRYDVAILLTEVSDISGGGGVERFFTDFFSDYQEDNNKKLKLCFILDEVTFIELKRVNRLNEHVKDVLILPNYFNRFKDKLIFLHLLYIIIAHRIKILHIANYNVHYFKIFTYLSKFKYLLNFRILNTVVDCAVPYVLNNASDGNYQSYRERYVVHPNKLKFDGVLTWYELFVEYFKKNELYSPDIYIQNVTCRYVRNFMFKPVFPKQKIIVFASRMSSIKNPDWFVKAVCFLLSKNDEKINSWKFMLIGKGEIEKQIENLIIELNITHKINRTEESDLSKIFPYTSCFVSTQSYENFPSLSMMEAMACGNAIITRNVGQTHLLVKDNYNGFYLEEDSPEGLANAMLKFINLTDPQREKLQKNSIEVIRNNHTYNNFKLQIESFWSNFLRN